MSFNLEEKLQECLDLCKYSKYDELKEIFPKIK